MNAATPHVYRLDDSNLPLHTELIGGKALGLAKLARSSAPTLGGIVLTTSLFEQSLRELQLEAEIQAAQADLAVDRPRALAAFADIAARICNASLAHIDVCELVTRELAGNSTPLERSWAVRSSCSLEDGRLDSFAGMFESYLNVPLELLEAHVLKCYASLYSAHCVQYAHDRGVAPAALRMAVIIQPAIDARASGVAFSVDSRARSRTQLLIEAVVGMGEGLVSGSGTPDRFTLCRRPLAPVGRQLSECKPEAVRFAAAQGTQRAALTAQEQSSFSIDWDEALELARTVLRLERKFEHAIDVEWLIDAQGKLWIVQARPLQVPDVPQVLIKEKFTAPPSEAPLATGQPITDRIVRGTVRWIDLNSAAAVPGEVVIARSVDVDWLPLLRNATAVIAMEGGWTSHIAIILREQGVPTLFAAGSSAYNLHDGEQVTVDCSGTLGKVYHGHLPSERIVIQPDDIYAPTAPVYLVCSAIETVEDSLRFPVSGVGLVRMEFIIHEHVKVHPLAVRDYDRGTLDDPQLLEIVRKASRGFATASQWYTETVANAICNFASRCPGKPVNVRLPDLLSDDYLTLAGGSRYESQAEPNPMMGWRGTTKLISDQHREAFVLDCRALHEVIERRRFYNVNVLLPFCRTPKDAAAALTILRENGVTSARLGMMVEIPANVVLGDKFAPLFDFFLVGPMDLTQFTYAADRKTTRLGSYSNETDATREMVKIFLSKLAAHGFEKDVFIGGWPLFQHYREYQTVQGHNRLKMVELPDRLLEVFENLRAMESVMTAPQAQAPARQAQRIDIQ
jgi:pyruvate,water dikinase